MYCKFIISPSYCFTTLVLIVAKCIVNVEDIILDIVDSKVLIVAKCIVNS